MEKKKTQLKRITFFSLMMIGFTSLLIGVNSKKVEAVNFGGPTHIGTFEGSTTFMTSSSNGVNPGLYLEVMDRYGKVTEYESEDGIITVSGTKEGAYVTQAKLLGKTKYVDQDTGEILDEWEAGRNLKLESSKMSTLTTIGKNLVDIKGIQKYGGTANLNVGENGVITIVGSGAANESSVYTNKTVHLKEGKQYTFSCITDGVFGMGDGTDTVEVFLMEKGGTQTIQQIHTNPRTFTCTSTGDYTLRFDVNLGTKTHTFSNIQIEESSVSTSHEPYQSNTITISEEVKLRGIGEIQDELNLITGELTQRIGEIVFDGSDDERWFLNTLLSSGVTQFTVGGVTAEKDIEQTVLCDRLRSVASQSVNDTIWLYNGSTIVVHKTLSNVDDLRNWLSQNPLTVQYRLRTESVQTVGLNSTYTFGKVSIRDVYVAGDISPLICSVSVPTEEVTFALNPNLERQEQFISPTFDIVNETWATIRVKLKKFEQITTVLNDVLPNHYEDWDVLNQEQSKNIALALVPIASEGWETLNEKHYYVAEASNVEIGQIKGKETVGFTFEALHGQAFIEGLYPIYRLVLVFSFE